MQEFITKFFKWSYVTFTFIVLFIWLLLLVRNIVEYCDDYTLAEHLLYLGFLPASWLSIRKKLYICHRINLCTILDIIVYASLFNTILYILPDDICIWPVYFTVLIIYKLLHCAILRVI